VNLFYVEFFDYVHFAIIFQKINNMIGILCLDFDDILQLNINVNIFWNEDVLLKVKATKDNNLR
jgi:hypothetical protein